MSCTTEAYLRKGGHNDDDDDVIGGMGTDPRDRPTHVFLSIPLLARFLAEQNGHAFRYRRSAFFWLILLSKLIATPE